MKLYDPSITVKLFYYIYGNCWNTKKDFIISNIDMQIMLYKDMTHKICEHVHVHAGINLDIFRKIDKIVLLICLGAIFVYDGIGMAF